VPAGGPSTGRSPVPQPTNRREVSRHRERRVRPLWVRLRPSGGDGHGQLRRRARDAVRPLSDPWARGTVLSLRGPEGRPAEGRGHRLSRAGDVARDLRRLPARDPVQGRRRTGGERRDRWKEPMSVCRASDATPSKGSKLLSAPDVVVGKRGINQQLKTTTPLRSGTDWTPTTSRARSIKLPSGSRGCQPGVPSSGGGGSLATTRMHTSAIEANRRFNIEQRATTTAEPSANFTQIQADFTRGVKSQTALRRRGIYRIYRFYGYCEMGGSCACATRRSLSLSESLPSRKPCKIRKCRQRPHAVPRFCGLQNPGVRRKLPRKIPIRRRSR